jgi:galactokinase
MQITSIFQQEYSKIAELVTLAPGRVNLLGEHVDYNNGLVLPCAIDRAVKLAASSTHDRIITLYAVDLHQHVAISLDNLSIRQDLHGKPLPQWAIYPAGVAWSLQEAGLKVHGITAAYTSDIPIGSGLSSSAAVEVAFAATWQALAGWQLNRLELAKLCQRAENLYVGVNSGLMDQFTSACGQSGHALFFDTRSLEYIPVPLPADTVIVVADSGVRRSLTHSGYNERRLACEQAVEILRQYMPHLHSLRDITPSEFAAYAQFLPEIPRKRAEHVVKEIQRVQSAVIALHRNDQQSFAALMYAGHASLRDLYQVSTPELNTLVDIAHHLPGCRGARLTGAGFGGCTVNMVEQSYAQGFMNALSAGYQRETGRIAQVYLCKASDGVFVKAI